MGDRDGQRCLREIQTRTPSGQYVAVNIRSHHHVSRAVVQSRNCFAYHFALDCFICSWQIDFHPFLQKERMTWWVTGRCQRIG